MKHRKRVAMATSVSFLLCSGEEGYKHKGDNG